LIQRTQTQSLLRQPAIIFRAGGWWEFKFGPILALVYGTALQSRISLFTHWPTLLGIVVALACIGAWANVLNDWTDIDEDRSGGKSNRIAGKPRWLPLLLVLVTGVVGWVVALWLRPGMTGLVLYFCTSLVFILYSVPPFRLKVRGVWGILADAAGAHTLPALFAIVTISTAMDIRINPAWLTLATIWSFAYGLRGILWHQISDYENDRRAGVHTFVCAVGPTVASRLGERIIFPLEIVALAGILWWCASPLPVIFLALDILLSWRDHERANRIIVVAPRRQYRIFLHEFNVALLPVALLMTAAIYHPWDAVILVVHICLFPKSLLDWVPNYMSRTISRSAR
jgi:4-hydroxybenzoate polyprenyltransferase